MKTILVTGGLGYIGSHTVVELLNNDYNVIIIDNLSNSELFILDRIGLITKKKPDFYELDVRNSVALNEIIRNYSSIDGIIHFAAFKAVNESINKPLEYYDNNLNSLISILRVIDENNLNNLVFSSSCTVYGQPDKLPVTEDTPFKEAWSPYGFTKQICESIIKDYSKTKNKFKAVSLRYFNPVGAHRSGLIGELPKGVPNNLMPYITQTAVGIRKELSVYGDDYNTPDGTAIRDYIHVSDLATAHLKALDYLWLQENKYYDEFNIGTGIGYSVLDVINSINKFIDKPLPYKIVEKREGDAEKIWALPDKANNILGWHPVYNLDDMTSTSLNWERQLKNSL